MASKIICTVTGIEIPSEPCETCKGTGQIPTGHTSTYGLAHGTCQTCEGSGRVQAHPSHPLWAIYDLEFAAWQAAKVR